MKSQSKIELKVSDVIESTRLDKYLALLPEIQTRSRALHLIEKDLVRVNGKPCKPALAIKGGETIEIVIPESNDEEIKPLDLKLEILFEDEDLIVLNKPAGLVVHPAAGHSDDTLVNALVHHTSDLSMKFGENRPGIVHRLDKDTSGLLVIAKNDFSHQHLSNQFKNRTIHRIYYALVEGQPRISKGRIESYLSRHPTDRKRFSSVRDEKKVYLKSVPNYAGPGKWAVTDYEVLKANKISSYVKLKLHTGRTHQIRVHMSELGCPLAGDEIYGRRKPGVKVSGLALLAAELGFDHPRDGRQLLFKVDWPIPLQVDLKKLGILSEDN